MGNIIRVLAILSVLFGAGAIVASAQINQGATVKVPFSFNVGDRTYEAGQYDVKIAKSGLGAASLTIRRQGTNESQTVLVRSFQGATNDQFQLVFGGEDNKFLAGIGTSSGSYLLVNTPQASNATLTAISKSLGKSKM